MTSNVLREYQQACNLLCKDVTQAIPGTTCTHEVAGVPIYPDYNQRDPRLATEQVDAPMLILTNVSKNAVLAIVPVALFDDGTILASGALSGTLAIPLRSQVSEVLALRDGRWFCLGSTPLPRVRRFPTLDIIETLRPVLSK